MSFKPSSLIRHDRRGPLWVPSVGLSPPGQRHPSEQARRRAGPSAGRGWWGGVGGEATPQLAGAAQPGAPSALPGGRGAGVYGRAGLQAGRRRAGAGAGARARAPASRARRAAMRRHAAAAAGSGASGGAAAPALSVSRLSSLDRVDVEREDMAGRSDAQPSTPRGGRGKGARAGAAAGVAKRKRTRRIAQSSDTAHAAGRSRA